MVAHKQVPVICIAAAEPTTGEAIFKSRDWSPSYPAGLSLNLGEHGNPETLFIVLKSLLVTPHKHFTVDEPMMLHNSSSDSWLTVISSEVTCGRHQLDERVGCSYFAFGRSSLTHQFCQTLNFCPLAVWFLHYPLFPLLMSFIELFLFVWSEFIWFDHIF